MTSQIPNPSEGSSAFPTGTVTLVVTEVARAMAHWDRLGARFDETLDAHRKLVREQVSREEGVEVQGRGSRFVVAFDRASSAVRFAMGCQEAFAAHEWPQEIGELQLGIAVHTGEPKLHMDKGVPSYTGADADLVLAIVAAAYGGQTLASDSAFRAATRHLDGVETTDLGDQLIYGVQEATRLWQLVPESLGQRTFAGVRAVGARPTNIPGATQSFVGRDELLDELIDLLTGDGAGLTTMTGFGGTGKTRTALELGRRLLPRLRGGVWVVELEEATTSAEICAAVSQALGVPVATPSAPEQSIANVLSFREPMLLILDNFEQAVEHAEKTVGFWRQQAPHVKILVTSRAVLGIRGERQFELPPLTTPDLSAGVEIGPEEALRFESVRLFVERAGEVKRNFVLDDSNAHDVATICADVEGMPLSIELAAARVKIVSPKQIAKKLGQQFQLLRSSRKDLPPRQRTLLGAIDWSFDLLEEWEKHAFMYLATFRGGFFVDDAESIVDLEEVFPDAPFVMDMVQDLHEKSLIRAYETAYGERHTMYRSIHEYARQKWQELVPEEARIELERTHAQHYLELAEEWGGQIHTEEARESLDRLELEADNLTKAQEASLDLLSDVTLSAETALAMFHGLEFRGHATRLVPALERAATALGPDPSELRTQVLTSLSMAREKVGPWDRVVALAEEAVRTSEQLETGSHRAEALLQLGKIHCMQGDLDSGFTQVEESEGIFRGFDDAVGLIRALNSRGNILKRIGKLDEAVEALEEAESLARQRGDLHWTAGAVVNRALIALQRGELDEALDCFKEAEALATTLDDLHLIPMCLTNQGSVYFLRGEFDSAADVYQRAEQIARKVGNRALMAKYLVNRATTLCELRSLDKALECLDEAEEIVRSIGNRAEFASVLRTRGQIEERRGEFEEALKTYVEAEAIHRDIGNQVELIECLNAIGGALRQSEDLEGALEKHAEAEEIAKRIANRAGIAESRAGRGRVLLDRGETEEARGVMEDVLSMYEEMNVTSTWGVFLAQTHLAQAEGKLGHESVASELAGRALELAQELGLLSSNDPNVQSKLSQLTLLKPEPMSPDSDLEATTISSVASGETVDLPPPDMDALRTTSLGSSEDPFIGRTLGGCKIESLLGRGGMGGVYKAVQTSVDRPVAIKILLPELFRDHQYVERFRREARTIGKFRSPYVVQVHEVGEEQSVHFLVMEFVDGGDLGEHAKTQPDGRLPARLGARFLEQACEGMLEAEELQVVHRDLKPENLLLDRGRTVKIADFGVAKLREASLQLTVNDQVLGTPIYMSPEQCMAEPVSHQSDMYCLGAAFYHLLTGEAPVKSTTLLKLAAEKDQCPYLSPREQRPETSEGLDHVIRRLTARKPKDRYTSFRDALDDLAHL